MAVEFKSIKTQNLSAKASVYTVPNTKTAFILSFFVTNKTATDAVVSVMFRSGGIDYYITSEKIVPVNSSIQPNDGRKICLVAGDMIYLESTENIDIILSIMEST